MIMVYLILTHTQKLDILFDEKILNRLSSNEDVLPLKIRNMILFGAIFFMIVAMARPIIDKGEQKVKISGVRALVALDISGSMRCTDTPPKRLDFAKQKILNLFDEMSGSEFGLIAFSSSSFMVSPFTNDINALKSMLKGIDDQAITMDSTDFDILGEFSSNLLEQSKSKILIVFSDGGEKNELQHFEERIKKEKIKLYVVMIGSDKPANVVDENGALVRDREGKTAMSSRNDELGSIATASGGAYIVAKYDSQDIKALAKEIHTSNPLSNESEITINDSIELFYYPLSLALFLLLLAFISLPKRRIK